MGMIDIDLGVLNQIVASLKFCTEDLGYCESDIKGIKETIPNAWQGASVYDYTACLGKTESKIHSLKNEVDSIMCALNGTISSVEEAERKLREAMAGEGSGGGGGGSW